MAVSYLDQYRLLVLRRSPIASRPPANFRRVYSTRFYDVWKRGPGPTVLEHLPIARATTEAGGVASCAELRTYLYIVSDIGYADAKDVQPLMLAAREVGKVIGGFRSAVASNIRSRLSTQHSALSTRKPCSSKT